jgi:uncharacterized protein
MSLIGEHVLLRTYLTSADRVPHTPTYERILRAARTDGLAGATVLRGILGWGRRGFAQASTWSMVRREPIIIEIVDTADKITRFIRDSLSPIMTGGLVTLERAAVLFYRRRTAPPTNSLDLAAALTPLSTIPKIEPGANMTINQNGVLLRVFIGESDRHEHKPLFEAIVQKVRELHLSGATVLRGTEGFGANSLVHRSSLLEMSSDLPIVVEIVDTEEKIKLLLPHLQTMVQEGMITMEYVVILAYRHDPQPPADASKP